MLSILDYPNQFVNNKYALIYMRIIANATNRKHNTGYVEKHHIIPKSILPELQTVPENVVALSAKEHFICHLLLPKVTIGSYKSKMTYALWAMCNQKSKYQGQRHTPTSRQYDHAKKLAASQLMIDRRGKTLEQLHGVEKAAEIRQKLSNRPARPPLSRTERDNFSSRVKENHAKGVYKNTGFNGRKLARKVCDYCQRSFDLGNFSRHHGDRCKYKSSQ